jgi:hypothetical protein
MDCREYKELLDSFFCEELAVETNHAMLRHAESCGSCRTEMNARRSLRQSMRRACQQESMSAEARLRLHECLRKEALDCGRKSRGGRQRNWLIGASFFPFPPTIAFATMAVVFLGGVGWLGVYLYNHRSDSESVKLNDQLFEEAIGDHRRCVQEYQARQARAAGESMESFGSSFPGLDSSVQSAAVGGLALCSKHECLYEQRRFAHLIYSGRQEFVSLMVTDRDGRALGRSGPPADDGSGAGCQSALKEQTALGVYQSRKYIVFLISALPLSENTRLAEQLAAPVAVQLRQSETTGPDRIGSVTFSQIDKLNIRTGIQASH